MLLGGKTCNFHQCIGLLHAKESHLAAGEVSPEISQELDIQTLDLQHFRGNGISHELSIYINIYI